MDLVKGWPLEVPNKSIYIQEAYTNQDSVDPNIIIFYPGKC